MREKDAKTALVDVEVARKEENLPLVALIHTDGSGHVDGFYGAAAYVTLLEHPIITDCCFCCGTHGSVEFSELQAIVSGLKLMDSMRRKREGFWTDILRPPAVVWFTDRESLALCCWRPGIKSNPFYARRKNPELWAAYEFFEKQYRIYPIHIKRNSMPIQEKMDNIAGRARSSIKLLFSDIFPKIKTEDSKQEDKVLF
jgi:hypothetical protein